MQTVTAVVDSNRLEPFVPLPDEFQNQNVEITIRLVVNRENESAAAEKCARLEGLQQLLKYRGTLHRRIDCKKELAEARDEKYGRSH
jgi:hypothetical protein